jgi:glycosyltransferase involved in cell wall biosynthesis
LAEAIASVRAQTCPLHHIIVDDGSTDASLQIARDNAPQAEILALPHQGHAAALNAGLSKAKTPWIAFLDADDQWTEDALSKLLRTAEQQAGFDLVFGHYVEFACGAALEAGSPWKARSTPQPAMVSGGFLARRELIERLGGFDETLNLGVFVDLFARAREANAHSKVIDDVIFRRRVHGANMSITQQTGRASYLRLAQAALRRRPRQ